MEANSNTVESGAQGLGKSLLEISRLYHILALFVSGKGDLGVDGLVCRFGGKFVVVDGLDYFSSCGKGDLGVDGLSCRFGGKFAVVDGLDYFSGCLGFLRFVLCLAERRIRSLEAAGEDEEDDSRKNKVTVFFGTQTGTTEGFANVRSGFVSSFLANEKWRLFHLGEAIYSASQATKDGVRWHNTKMQGM